MKISLACIAGNCERDIHNFLDQFQPFFDEVIIVRAVGNLEPDKTLAIAEEHGCIVSEYFNAPENNWPHVDNFAAARNQAWQMASGDWVAWADIDDHSQGFEHVRSTLESLPDTVSLVRCPYMVPEQRIDANYRERFARRGKFHWVQSIHEYLVPIDPMEHPVADTSKFAVVHAPRHDRESSNGRNLRILESIPADERTHGHLFYLFTELTRTSGRQAESIQTAQQFLSHPDSGEAERYEVALQLASLADEPAMIAQWLLHAYGECPHRAEALYELAHLELTHGKDPKRALAFAKQALTAKMPDGPDWNYRRAFYGWASQDLHRQVLRHSGQQTKADALEMTALRQSGEPIISLLHATRGRMVQATKTRTLWLDRATHPESIEHIFAFDRDDKDSYPLTRFRHVVSTGEGRCVQAWNLAASVACGEILVQCSDDFEPPKGWDESLRAEMGDTKDARVLRVSDGNRTDGLLTMAIVSRGWYRKEGLFHPDFRGMFSDNWFTHVSQKSGCIKDCAITFRHHHPAFGGGEMDETYARQNAEIEYKIGESIYNRLQAGQITSQQVEGWCDFRDLYWQIAELLPDGGSFVEVGCWKGQSIICLAQRLQDLGKQVELHVVDTFQGDKDCGEADIYSEFVDNINRAGVADMIRIIRMPSIAAAMMLRGTTYDGIFIDASHDYADVKADLKAWLPNVKDCGIFAGHDYDSEGVKKAVNETIKARPVSARCWIKEQ